MLCTCVWGEGVSHHANRDTHRVEPHIQQQEISANKADNEDLQQQDGDQHVTRIPCECDCAVGRAETAKYQKVIKEHKGEDHDINRQTVTGN